MNILIPSNSILQKNEFYGIRIKIINLKAVMEALFSDAQRLNDFPKVWFIQWESQDSSSGLLAPHQLVYHFFTLI